MHTRTLSLDEYVQGLTQGSNVVLARAITLVESLLEEDQRLASQLIQTILPQCGNSLRIGITGVPGVGKSTFIEALGKQLTSRQKKIAVLAVDPSSAKTKGSILGDKTRMDELAKDPLAFIRPSPAGPHLGGVAGKTREAILLCEAAGYQVIIVETVGVGQSEMAVREMTDFFLLLMLAGAGDELQGIKKGIIEMADAIVINKADGDNLARVRQTQADLRQAMHYMTPTEWGWATAVLTCSALQRTGINEVWTLVEEHQSKSVATGAFLETRHRQNKQWMMDCFNSLVHQALLTTSSSRRRELEEQVEQLNIHPPEAARMLFAEIAGQWKP